MRRMDSFESSVVTAITGHTCDKLLVLLPANVIESKYSSKTKGTQKDFIFEEISKFIVGYHRT